MIKLTKANEPIVLRDNRESWEQVIRDHAASGTKASDAELGRYNHADIKDALLGETSGKCAYCESKFRHVTYGDIEHIIPKKLGVEHRFRWENLTIGCDVCNTKKGKKENLIDPYVEEPEAEFVIFGPMVLPNPTSDRATVTESALELNRKDLVERRVERIKYLQKMLHVALSMKDEADRQVLLDELRTVETTDGVEYAALSRSFVRDLQAKGILPVE